VIGTFVGVVVLAGMIDYFELMRRGADWPKATAWILAEISVFRIPQLTEKIMPFAVLIGAMSCYLALSRRLELIIARAAGISAWQFVAPAVVVAFLFGAAATAAYNPLAATLHERSKRLESEMLGETSSALQESAAGFWVRQKSADGAAIINAKSSREQGSMRATSASESRREAPNSMKAIGCSRTRAFIRRPVRPSSRTATGSTPI
jgi:lipopolysaccharide export system permease protein